MECAVSIRANFLLSASAALWVPYRVKEQGGCPLDGELPVGALPEVRIREYTATARNRRVVQVQPPALMALSALGETPRALRGLGTYPRILRSGPEWRWCGMTRRVRSQMMGRMLR